MSKQSDYNRRKRSEGADVGAIPPVVNAKRREACQYDLERFLVEYFPDTTGLSPFSEAHKRAIAAMQSVIINGGVLGNVLPRGFAKTTISENGAIWAANYRHRKFIPIFGADEGSALENLSAIKRTYFTNDLLFEDFPEICHPIIHIDNKPQRAWNQTHIPGNMGGNLPSITAAPRPTGVQWKADTIVLPTIYNADMTTTPGSGVYITTRGLGSGARGMKYRGLDGKQERPDFAIIDDPQTDESAQSPTQIAKRLSIIQKSIMRLSSHVKKMSIVLNATIIQPNDLIETMMDSKRFPAWQFIVVSMMPKFSDRHDDLWLGKYAEIRNKWDRDKKEDRKRAHAESNRFYIEHRAEMDAGAVITWEYCFIPDEEVSAIHHAYNILIDEGPDVFASECQNSPTPLNDDSTPQLQVNEIIKRTNGISRTIIPVECDKLTAFIDVQGEALFWVVTAWNSSTFAGHVVDYGTWPEQPTRRFALNKLRHTLSEKYKVSTIKDGKMDKGAILYAALTDLRNYLTERKWVNENAAAMTINRGFIDYGWEESENAVYAACRNTSEIWIPSKGKGVAAARTSFDMWKKLPGATYGKSWKISRGGRGIPVALFETNYWKTFVRELWLSPIGSATSLQLYGEEPEEHRLFGEHAAAERATLVTADGRTILEWDNDARREQHWGDGIVGCAVAASTVGVKTPEQHEPETKRARRSLKALQKQRRSERRAG